MAENKTTLSSAVASGDTVINVASATNLVAGQFLLVDGEVMQITKSYVSGTAIPVLRGLDGGVNGAHPNKANVSEFIGSDLAGLAPSRLSRSSRVLAVRVR